MEQGLNSGNFEDAGPVRELQALLKELQEKDLPPPTWGFINDKIEHLNLEDNSRPEKGKEITAAKKDILKHLQKEHGLVPEKYYTTLWMSLGMSVFGVPVGVLLYAITSNPAFIAVGIPIGLGAGTMYGATLDEKAKAEGKVLNFTGKN